MTDSERCAVVAARISEKNNQGLSELVTQGLFSDKSSAIRYAIGILLHETPKGAVNDANAEDEVSNSIKELFSLQGKGQTVGKG